MSNRTTTINRLTIGGFKSFADEVRIDILPGLTGIIGPNGCGKSNVVEGLRWAMGETSARALRGGELDDLIFAGTGARAARNIAQVTLALTGTTGLAPAPFQDADELEISRRAERGSGSEYRINGRVMRARDVQTLFADLASGARSSAIISQNRVGQLIAAKPEERRLLLEEAAGITGLHARRHDAELKLRQTETNLSRAEDLRLQLEERLESLEGQTVQAKLYREISNHIRETETALHALLHARANLAVQRSRDDLAKAREFLKKAEAEAEAAAIADFEARKAAPEAREDTDRLRAALERLRVKSETLRQDLDRAQSNEIECRNRLEQAESDYARAETLAVADREAREIAGKKLAALSLEADALPQRKETSAEVCANLETLEREQAIAFENATRLRDAEAIRRDTMVEAIRSLESRLEAESGTLRAIITEIAALDRDTPNTEALSQLREEVAESSQNAAKAARNVQDLERNHQDARLKAELDGRALTEGQARLAALQANERDLERRLAETASRLAQDLSTRETAQAQVLSDDARATLVLERDQAVAKLNQAEKNEQIAREEQDRASAVWLQARAAAEDGMQRHKALLRTIEQARQTLDDTKRKVFALTSQEQDSRAALVPDAELDATRKTVRDAESRLDELTRSIGTTEQTLAALRDAETAAGNALATIDASILRGRSECEGLEQGLSVTSAQPDPLEDALAFPADLSRAVAAALSDGLDASLAPESVPADRRWRDVSHAGTLPSPMSARIRGCTPLAELVSAPAAVRFCLGAVYLLENESDGPSAQSALLAGEILVGRSGALWRWDGFTRTADAPDAGALRLEQRRRLNELRDDLATSAQKRPALLAALEHARLRRQETERALAILRQQRSQTEPLLAHARTAASRLEQKAALAQNQFEQAQQRLVEAVEATQRAQQSVDDTTAEHQTAPPPDTLTAQAERLGHDAEIARSNLREANVHLQTTRSAADAAERFCDQAFVRHDAALVRLQDINDGLARLEEEQKRLLSQRTMLRDQPDRPDLSLLQTAAETSRAASAQLQAELETATRTAQDTRNAADRLTQDLNLKNQAATAATARRSALEPRQAELGTLVARLRQEHDQKQGELDSRPDPKALAQAVHDTEQPLQETRHLLAQARTEDSHLALEDVRLAGSLLAVRERIATLTARIETGAQALEELAARRDDLLSTFEKARAIPAELAEKLTRHDLALAQAQTAYDEARARDEAMGAASLEAQESRRAAEQALSNGREAIGRLTERAEQAVAARERLLGESDPPVGGSYPRDLSDQAETTTRRRLSRLTREREELGAVNLRAEAEYEDARQTAETIAREHAELTAAIHRLRGGIGTINREGRERLSAVFAEVDRHFQSLFSRMFGGGRAHLGLVGSDDPLEAGLEIFAQPPGKKLSTLSLLSGGEQALTALSLIFATFRCNPAPICVLDEVDAPLDDANVERFCSLLSDMTKEAGTRFLVVTHHQLTMAHMDRLYGVTMQERGVSRVLSVDLGGATTLVGG